MEQDLGTYRLDDNGRPKHPLQVGDRFGDHRVTAVDPEAGTITYDDISVSYVGVDYFKE